MVPPVGLPPRINSSTSSSTGPTIAVPHAVSRPTPPPRGASTDTAMSALTIDTDEPSIALAKQHCMSERGTSSSSRDSLRLQVNKCKFSLTVPEQTFLDELAIHGNEIEVQLAMEKLQDSDLFFDYQTPRHLKYPHNHIIEESKHGPAMPSLEAPRPGLTRSISMGSQRRLMALENRRNSTQQTQLWKAHQSGLAVTSQGSRQSLLRRSASTANSGLQGKPPMDIFRNKEDAAKSARPSQPKRTSLTHIPRGQPRPRSYRRSQSVSILQTPPPPGPLIQRTSTSSRKSVTFHQQTDGTPKPRPRTKSLRRSVSDSLQDYPHDQTPVVAPLIASDPKPHPHVAERQESTSSIPSLHHGHPIRQESSSSIPSLHHGHPIRQESSSSIPSLHHGHPIRQESMSSIPSLHHGHPIRQESMSSVPSLHHGHPIRQESMSSVPSLHHGHPIRQESLGSVPSLHHGHQLHDDAASSVYMEQGKEGQDTKPLMPQYVASDDIANAWLQQSSRSSNIVTRKDSQVTFGSLPNNVAIPSDETETSDSPEAIEVEETPVSPGSQPSQVQKPVMMRLASRTNVYEGEGIEVTEMDASNLPSKRMSTVSLLSLDASVRTCSSYDDTASYRHPEIFRGIQRSLSDEDMSNFFLGTTTNLLLKEVSNTTSKRVVDDSGSDEDDESWDLGSDADGRFDSWNVLKDEYVNGYGGGGTLGFAILGTDADDESAQPHVLSPPLMESLQAFLPYAKSGENFFLKYSMIRDGASLHTFLKRARGVQHAILALETVEGEVFGAFTGQPWRKNWNYFGTGESFLWRMRHSRLEKTHGILEQAHLESEIDVFPYTGENRYIQLCTQNRIAVGGGTPAEKKDDDVSAADPALQDHEWGFGLAIANDFLTGTSSPCVTFGSPSLSKAHPKGSVFEIINIELWTLTPCMTVEQAEKLELGKFFLERN